MDIAAIEDSGLYIALGFCGFVLLIYKGDRLSMIREKNQGKK